MIRFNNRKKMFYIGTKNSSYVFGVNSEKLLYHAYYGRRLKGKRLSRVKEVIYNEIGYHKIDNRKSNFLPEFPVYDGHNVFENSLKVSLSNGTRSLDLVYSGHAINKNLLKVKMRDRKYRIKVSLLYKVIPGLDLIEKSVVIANNEKRLSLTLEAYDSGGLVLPAGKYNLGFLQGRWIKEAGLCFEEISYGKKVLESRSGHSSHMLNPSFFITKEKALSEDKGEYYFGQLMWSGSWKFTFEKRIYDAITFTGGINSFDGHISLRPGGKLETPPLLIGYSGAGLGCMSNNLHDYYRHYVLPQRTKNNIERVLVNSWEAFYFSINEEKLLKLAQKARHAGADILVVDDGWFRKRDNDGNSLGDWEVIPAKFPHGMAEFGRKIKKMGLKFGIWVEPENMNTDSKLYRKHPDWCYHFPGRPRAEMRHTVALNLTRKDVMNYLKKTIKKVIKQYKPDYVKWDMNRYISEAGPNMPVNSTLWIEHIKEAYSLMEYMKKLNPKLILEGCAGGGGRVSGGIFRYVDQVWASDNNDPVERQYIQYGTSLFYPAQVMCNHVGDSPYDLTGRHTKLSFRIHTAMAGNMGTEANLLKWTKPELKLFKESISLYKRIRHIIFKGDLYRIEGPYNSSRVSFMYVTKDKKEGVLFSFNKNKRKIIKDKKVRLKGLKPGILYVIQKNGGKQKIKGIDLMRSGIKTGVNKYMDSVIIRIMAG